MNNEDRLKRIHDIIEAVDRRAMHADGPVTPTLQEMTQGEMDEIYSLADGRALERGVIKTDELGIHDLHMLATRHGFLILRPDWIGEEMSIRTEAPTPHQREFIDRGPR